MRLLLGSLFLVLPFFAAYSYADNHSPKEVEGGKATYPIYAKANCIEGYVVAELDISEQGYVDKVTIVEAAPHGVFENAAYDAWTQTIFEPKITNGRAVEFKKLRVKKEFSLNQPCVIFSYSMG